ncbi:hypothetical protein L195_g032129, partial [Trifolium pratense]
GVVPSTLHQRVTIWREDGVVKNIEADRSYYLSEVNYITKQTFDKNLASIAPCGEKNAAYEDLLSDCEVYHSVKLHPTHGFMWKREVIDSRVSDDEEAPSPGGWDDMFIP